MSSLQDYYATNPAEPRSDRFSIPLDGTHESIGPFSFRPRSIMLVNQTQANLIAEDDRGEQYIAAQSVGATYGTSDTLRFECWLDTPVTSGKCTVVVSEAAAGVAAAQLSSFAAAAAGSGAVQVLAYNEFLANVAVAATTEATSNLIVAAPAVTLDGTTIILVEFFCPLVVAAAQQADTMVLFEDGAPIGRIAQRGPLQPGVGNGLPVHASRRLTPLAGAHTYSIRGFGATAAGATYNAGAGGTGALVPGFIRISKEG